jgi:hypothetical protein
MLLESRFESRVLFWGSSRGFSRILLRILLRILSRILLRILEDPFEDPFERLEFFLESMAFMTKSDNAKWF